LGYGINGGVLPIWGVFQPLKNVNIDAFCWSGGCFSLLSKSRGAGGGPDPGSGKGILSHITIDAAAPDEAPPRRIRNYMRDGKMEGVTLADLQRLP